MLFLGENYFSYCQCSLFPIVLYLGLKHPMFSPFQINIYIAIVIVMVMFRQPCFITSCVLFLTFLRNTILQQISSSSVTYILFLTLFHSVSWYVGYLVDVSIFTGLYNYGFGLVVFFLHKPPSFTKSSIVSLIRNENSKCLFL